MELVSDSPRVLGNRYEVGELLGRGGMAEVHLGRDARLGRTVAIKLLRNDLARDATFQARFRREAQSAAALNHPAIVAVYDTGEETVVESGGAVVNLPYIVMEFIEGRTLRDVLGEGHHLDVDAALEITTGVLTALEYSHRIGIVHRDIKPANVMLTPVGDVKVMDFGIARAMSDASSTMTQTQAVIGTAQYLSPEQARGEQVDTRSDLYSAGCLLYELLTGRPPFVADSPVAVAYQHVREQPIPPSHLVAGIPESVDRIVLHSLAKGRDERYQTAADFRADVEAARGGRQVYAAAPVMYGSNATTQYVPPVEAAGTRAMAPVPGLAGNTSLGQQTGLAGQNPYDQYPPDTGYGRRTQPEPERSNRGPILIGIVIVVVLALVGYFVAKSFGGSDSSSTVKIYSVVGEPVATAINDLTKQGFDPNKITQTPTVSAKFPKGAVINQDPTAGTSVKTSATVTLQISSGTGSVAVTDVAGDTLADATTALEAQGLTVNNNPKYVISTTQSANHVVKTKPAAGDTVKPGTSITLYLPQTTATVPANLLGMSFSDAKVALKKAGLKYTTSKLANGDVDPGTVLTANPGPGSTVPTGSSVALVLAEAEPTSTPTATMPTSPTATTTSAPPVTTSAPAPTVSTGASDG